MTPSPAEKVTRLDKSGGRALSNFLIATFSAEPGLSREQKKRLATELRKWNNASGVVKGSFRLERDEEGELIIQRLI